MKKWKLTFIGVGAVVIIFTSVFVIINNSLSKVDPEVIEVSAPIIQPELLAVHEKKVKEAEVITNYLQEENGFFEQVGNRLTEEGYKFKLMLAVNSSEDIQVKYILTNKVTTETEQEEVESIFYEIVEKNNIDPQSFTLSVSDSDDGPDW